MHFPEIEFQSTRSSDNITSKRLKGILDAKSRAIRLLFAVSAAQALFFLLVVSESAALLLATIAFCAFWLLIIVCLPSSARGVSFGGQTLMGWGRWLPLTVLALAVFKIVTRSEMYFTSFVEGFSFARQLIDERANSGGSLQAVVNVFLTPLWINLVIARGDNRSRLGVLECLAIAAVPLIALFDMLLFGGRVIFAFQMVILFVAGVFRPRFTLLMCFVFVGAFIYVHASRTAELFELGFSYLALTASGELLPPLHDLDAMGVPEWFLGPLVLAQYIAHPIAEVMHIVSVLPWWSPTFATFGDQIAALGFGDRSLSQDWLEQVNPRFGSYQTFFGPFLIDFGLVGIGAAIAGLAIFVGLSHCARGHLRQVMVILMLSNLALASIDNFFVMGGGFSQSILAVLLAFTFFNRTRGVTQK